MFGVFRRVVVYFMEKAEDKLSENWCFLSDPITSPKRIVIFLSIDCFTPIDCIIFVQLRLHSLN